MTPAVLWSSLEFYTAVNQLVVEFDRYLCNPDHKLEVADAYLSSKVRRYVAEMRIRDAAKAVRTGSVPTPRCPV